MSEHAAWLRVNCGRQAENYAAFARDWEEGRRAHDPHAGREEPAATVELDAEQRRCKDMLVLDGTDSIRGRDWEHG